MKREGQSHGDSVKKNERESEKEGIGCYDPMVQEHPLIQREGRKDR